MTKEQLRELNIIKTVHRKGSKYAVNGAPYQSVMSLVTFLFKQRSVVVSEGDMKELLDELCTDEKVKEKMIQEKIQKMFGGKREVHTPVGYIDLLTDTEILECKLAKDWKGAIGQVISYHRFYPDREKALYLFGSCPKNISECYQLCKENKIRLYCEFW